MEFSEGAVIGFEQSLKTLNKHELIRYLYDEFKRSVAIRMKSIN